MKTARPLRVLHVIPTLTGGGAENFLCALVPSFDQNVVSAGIMAIYPTAIPLEAEVRQRVPVLEVRRSGRYDPGFFGRMVRATRAFRPDIVHAHLHNGKYWGRLAAMAARVPIVVFTEHNPCGEHRILPELLVDYAVNRLTDGMATFAQKQQALVARAERLPLQKVVVLENGIALPPSPNADLRAKARRELCLREDELAVLVVARLVPRKNQQLAIRAMQVLDEASLRRVRLFIIGGGEQEQLLRDLARSSGVAGGIEVLGNRDDAVGLLYGGDMFYMASLAEGMPLAMLEAMSVGLPIVSTPWTGVDALLDEGRLGMILGDWEADTTARAFALAVRSPGEFRERAQTAMELVRSRHDIARVARLHEAWYAQLAQARGLRRAG